MQDQEARQEKAQEILGALAHHTGSQGYHRVSMFRWLLATDGVADMAERCKAYWLIDAIGSHQRRALRDAKLRQMQFWKLTVDRRPGAKFMARLVVYRDTDDRAFTQRIPYTDFPLESIDLWATPEFREDGKLDRVILMLKSEY